MGRVDFVSAIDVLAEELVDLGRAESPTPSVDDELVGVLRDDKCCYAIDFGRLGTSTLCTGRIGSNRKLIELEFSQSLALVAAVRLQVEPPKTVAMHFFLRTDCRNDALSGVDGACAQCPLDPREVAALADDCVDNLVEPGDSWAVVRSPATILCLFQHSTPPYVKGFYST